MPTKKLLKHTDYKDRFASKTNVMDCLVSAGSFGQILDKVNDYANNNISSYVCFANVHMLYEANRDDDFKSVVNAADIVCPDGRPVSLLMQALNNQKQERICGMDFMPALLQHAEDEDLKVYFYGSTPNVLDAIVSKIGVELPDLNVVGSYSPPFRKLSPQEDQEVIDMINNSGAQLVFVSLGCPKQEKWMLDHRGQINACMLGVGQAFKTYAGLEKRLPKPLRNLGLEWLYRLSIEPGRLWKRYLNSNVWFLFQCLKYLKAKKKLSY